MNTQEMGDYIRESVQLSIRETLNQDSDVVMADGIAYHWKANNRQLNEAKKYDTKKTENVMFLSDGGEHYIITKTENGINAVHVGGGSASQTKIGGEGKLKEFIADKATEGFYVVKNKREAKKIMRKSMRPLARIITNPAAIAAGLAGTLVALAAAFLPSGVMDSISGILKDFGISDSIPKGDFDFSGWQPIEVIPTPEVDVSGVEALIDAMNSSSQLTSFEETQERLLDLASRLDAEGATEQAGQVRQNIETLRASVARGIEQTALDAQSAMTAYADQQETDRLAQQAIQSANAGIVSNISNLFSLQAELERDGYDEAARDVARNIRQLQSQLR